MKTGERQYTVRCNVCAFGQNRDAGKSELWVCLSPGEIVGVTPLYGTGPIEHLPVPRECWQHVRLGAPVSITVVFEPAPAPGPKPKASQTP
jgi:hypothetical protein